MVQVKTAQHQKEDGHIHIEKWLAHLAEKYSQRDMRLIQNTCTLCQFAKEEKNKHEQEAYLQRGIAMAEILSDLDMDAESLAAAIIFEEVAERKIGHEDVAEHLGPSVLKLVKGVIQMNTMDHLMDQKSGHNADRIDNLRKMLLSIVDDMRVVLIKLAERTYHLRHAQEKSRDVQKKLALQIQNIYAPLANRLGIGQLKWELEDLSFRYLEPEIYKQISKHVSERRIDREQYVRELVAELNRLIQGEGVEGAEVQGRAKHIYSIYKKMSRKKVGFDQIYDVTAVRVLVKTIEDCYHVLSAVHGRWEHIPAEFDDYVTSPKPNGYRSIHTAVVGDNGKNFEVQIRTFEMHEESEMGFAAHWKYKEGVKKRSDYEDKIVLLRQILAWQKELSSTEQSMVEIPADTFNDRVYVFTPEGDIVDLPQDSTPLDFAYYIHSEIGHRCRGAKINDQIVPLHYILKTGDRVTILTGKQPKPSRDWLNPELGYLKTSRAKAKVLHFLRQEDYDKNLIAGEEMATRELRQLNLPIPQFDKLAPRFNYKNKKDLFAGIGNGDVRMSQIIGAVQSEIAEIKAHEPPPLPPVQPQSVSTAAHEETDIAIGGIGNLLTHIAKCCKPIPGDTIIGYITMGRGISIHRKDCKNIDYAKTETPDRILDVNWGAKLASTYPVDLQFYIEERTGLSREITALLSHHHVDIIAMNTVPRHQDQLSLLTLTITLPHIEELEKIISNLRRIPGVASVRRR